MTSEDRVTEEELDRYFSITEKALEKAKVKVPSDTHLHKMALDIKDMARRYLSDARHFRKEGHIRTSFASINYAHGWLDAGARMGLFDVDHDSELFTVD